MKHLLTFSLLLLVLLLPATASAHDFEVDGIYYNINGNVATVTYKGSNESEYDNEYSGLIIIPATVTNNGTTYSITSIGNWAFYGCTGLSTIVIPNSVTTIGDRAFYGCNNLFSISCDAITPPTMGSEVFSESHRLVQVWVPRGCTDTYLSADGWKDFDIISSEYDFNVDGIYYRFMNEDEVRVEPNPTYMYTGSITIPNTVTFNGNSYSVTSIVSNAFYGCTGLTSIVIPNSVTAISDFAFWGCTGLTSIVIPNSVTEIGFGAFGDCTGLTSIVIPNSVTSIVDNAFEACPGLTSIVVESGNPRYDSRNNCNAIIETASNTLITGCKNTIIPNSVTAIGYGAFKYCPSLTSIDIPNSVTAIGDYAFMYCPGLTSIVIPNSVTSIGDYAFSSCSGLTSIDIPNSVTKIGWNAFEDCTGLTSIVIPNSVTAIGDNAFIGCTGLTDVYCYIADPSTIQFNLGFYLPSGDYSNRTLHVPYGTLAAYQADSEWSQYFGTIVEMAYSILAVSIELDKSTAAMTEGETLQMTATVMPEDATNKTVAWASSNTSIATVDDNGLVAALSAGSATITATTADGSNLTASCLVTVKGLNVDNYFSMPDTSVFHGETITIPVQMNNQESIMAFQTDIFLPQGFSIVTDEDDEPLITPSSRLTSDHVIMAEQLNDGNLRVICYTPRSKVIDGNEGDLFYITVAVPEQASGDCNILLHNSLLTTTEYTELSIPDAAAIINVKTFTPGDVNDNRSVNVTDIVITAQYILQRNPSPFIFDAADMNGDGNVTVTDIMLIARIIMTPAASAPKRMPILEYSSDRLSGEGISIATGETRSVSIALDNAIDYCAFQLDIKLPEGLTASNVSLTDRAGSHALDVEAIGDGLMRVLCYSPELAAISGSEGALLTFDVTVTQPVAGDITVDGIELVTTGCQTVLPEAFTIAVNNMTAVTEVAASKTVDRIDYYNAAGQRLDSPASGLTIIVTTYTDGSHSTTKVIK